MYSQAPDVFHCWLNFDRQSDSKIVYDGTKNLYIWVTRTFFYQISILDLTKTNLRFLAGRSSCQILGNARPNSVEVTSHILFEGQIVIPILNQHNHCTYQILQRDGSFYQFFIGSQINFILFLWFCCPTAQKQTNKKHRAYSSLGESSNVHIHTSERWLWSSGQVLNADEGWSTETEVLLYGFGVQFGFWNISLTFLLAKASYGSRLDWKFEGGPWW